MELIANHTYLYIFAPMIFIGLILSLPIFNISKYTPKGARYESMDSMRFFLASAVVFHHSLLMFNLNVNGAWASPYDITKDVYLSKIAVSIFFAITGYLFWRSIKKESINWAQFYYRRFFRIAPLILFQSLLSIILILLITKGYPKWHPSFDEVLSWFNVFSNKKVAINNYSQSWVTTAGVYWTLVYEWGFYFSLPLLWFFRKNPTEFVIASLFLIVYGASYITNIKIPFDYIILFFIGMLVVEFKSCVNFNKKTLDILLLLSIVLLFKFRPPYFSVNSYVNVLIFIILFCIVNKADLFGLLRIPAFIYLGQVSYSIYIMHGIVLFVLYKLSFKSELLLDYFLPISYAAYFIIVGISCLTYKYIESYIYNLAKRFY